VFYVLFYLYFCLFSNNSNNSVEETEDLATSLLESGLFVVHNTVGGGHNQETELSGGKDIVGELLVVIELDIESGGDNTALVDSAEEIDNDFIGSVVIDNFEFTDISVLLHNSKESKDDSAGGSDEDLLKTFLLSVDQGLQTIGKDVHLHFCEGGTRIYIYKKIRLVVMCFFVFL